MVWLLSFNIVSCTLGFISAESVLCVSCRIPQAILIMELGFLLYGMCLMEDVAAIFKETPSPEPDFCGEWFSSLFIISLLPFLADVVSRSTLVPMAIGITLIRSGGLGIAYAVPIMLGGACRGGVLSFIVQIEGTLYKSGKEIGCF